MPARTKTSEMKEIRALSETGLSATKIAKQIQRSPSTVYRVLNKPYTQTGTKRTTQKTTTVEGQMVMNAVVDAVAQKLFDRIMRR